VAVRRAIAITHSPVPAHQRGLALLILLTFLVIAITAVIVSGASLNRLKILNANKDVGALKGAREALMAYGVNNAIAGGLPCPDTDLPQDGLENRTGSLCTSAIGWLPYKTLRIDNAVDSSGTGLWYSVSPAYTSLSVTNKINPSNALSLTVDGVDSSAVVIAPGKALQGQTRTGMNKSNFLEGENANNTLNIYAQVHDDTNNDLLLIVEREAYWSLAQQKVLIELSDLVKRYKTACGEFPWAANFVAGADNSITGLQQGTFPIDAALPSNWGTGCAAGITPRAELTSHWQDQIYYAFCTVAEGSCIQITGDSNQMVSALLIAPGPALFGQNRSSYALDQFFESDNIDGTAPFRYRKPNNINVIFNDLAYVVAP